MTSQPLPIKGIFVAVMVRNCTLASSGRAAIQSTVSATCWASKVGSAAVEPSACNVPRLIRQSVVDYVK